uniref:Uncharacterized protein n=1 Tax=Romanomermis culicivorax TaxID=13658 RepID=A0A915HMV2_ROMCU
HLTAYKVCCNDTDTLFEEKSLAFESNNVLHKPPTCMHAPESAPKIVAWGPAILHRTVPYGACGEV